MTSEINSVTSITYVTMLPQPLNAFIQAYLINATDAHFYANPLLRSSGEKPPRDERGAQRCPLVKRHFSI